MFPWSLSRLRKNGDSQPISHRQYTRGQHLKVAKLEAAPIFPMAALFLALAAPCLRAQAPAFEVASVKPNRSDAPASSRFPLGPGDAYVPDGGFFAATNQALIVYLRFAYKLGQGDLLGMPGWVYNERFDIEARAQGNPTKDQVRLMMRALLADRFKVITHTETRKRPVLDLVLLKAGKVGPQLRVDLDECAAGAAPSSTSGLQLPPIACGSMGQIPASAPGLGRLGGRRVTIARIAGFLTNPFTGVDRPVLDRTGLAGTFDFSLEWAVEDSDGAGPTFLQALRDQLGFKLKSATGPVEVLMVDHVERPTSN
jgi:uncharacterized protein (TIGR03435 family)